MTTTLARPVTNRGVLGADLQPGDVVGSAFGWKIAAVLDVVEGTCTDLTRARLGVCACAHPATAQLERMPRRIVRGTDGQRHVVFDHIRYARPAGWRR